MTPFVPTIFPGRLTPMQFVAKLSEPEEAAYALSFLKLQVVQACSLDTAASLSADCNGEFEFDQAHLDRYLATRQPIPLELDFTYLDRTGRRHGPLIAGISPHLDYPFRDKVSNICWMANGSYYDAAIQHDLDLIEQVF